MGLERQRGRRFDAELYRGELTIRPDARRLAPKIGDDSAFLAIPITAIAEISKKRPALPRRFTLG